MSQLGGLSPDSHLDWSSECARTHAQAYGRHAKHSYCHPTNQHWGACTPLRHLNLAQTNPPGAGQDECPGLMEKVSKTKDSWEFASPAWHNVEP